MSTASMESLCAMAQTPTAKTLKFPHAKEEGSHAMLPLFTQDRVTLKALGLTVRARDVELKASNRDCETVCTPEEERNSSGL